MREALFLALAACGASHARSEPDAPVTTGSDAAMIDAPAGFPETLDGQRDRLLATYYAYLEAHADTAMTNGLRGSDLHSVCEVWSALQPSAKDVFLTLTHRLWGSKLPDGTPALELVTEVYRIAPGTGATPTDPGSCGGEGNRMILSTDPRLHEALLAANTRQGAAPYDLADIATSWRNSQDLGGPHAPFDLSDETEGGAPRGQVQYFRDPTSTIANTALGRPDIMDVVDPYALEFDHDSDCTHNSNPDCSYVFYGPVCAPAANVVGTAMYRGNYGDFEPAWTPAGCEGQGDDMP
jgi:hypothetical protein